MEKIRARSVLLTLCVLSGCAGFPGREPGITPVSGNDAVVSLVNAAQSNISDGKYDAAAATLERALRLEPRNPALWHQLANSACNKANISKPKDLPPDRTVGQSITRHCRPKTGASSASRV